MQRALGSAELLALGQGCRAPVLRLALCLAQWSMGMLVLVGAAWPRFTKHTPFAGEGSGVGAAGWQLGGTGAGADDDDDDDAFSCAGLQKDCCGGG
jgi:hypothetical protein